MGKFTRRKVKSPPEKPLTKEDKIQILFKDHKKIIEDQLNRKMRIFSQFFKGIDSEVKSVNLVTSENISSSISKFKFPDNIGKCVKRLQNGGKIKSSYIVNENINFLSLEITKEDAKIKYLSEKDIRKAATQEIINRVEMIYMRTSRFVDANTLERYISMILSDILHTGSIGRLMSGDYRIFTNNVKTISPSKIIPKIFDQFTANDSALFNDAISTYKGSLEKAYEDGFHALKGDPIAFIYKEFNYKSMNGTLGNSCMRHSYIQPNKFDIYTKNRDTVSLLCYVQKNKLLGRAVLWKTVSGATVVDRVYYTHGEVYNKFVTYCNLNGIESIYSSNNGIKKFQRELKVELRTIPKHEVAYLDSFSGRFKGTNVLKSRDYPKPKGYENFGTTNIRSAHNGPFEVPAVDGPEDLDQRPRYYSNPEAIKQKYILNEKGNKFYRTDKIIEMYKANQEVINFDRLVNFEDDLKHILDNSDTPNEMYKFASLIERNGKWGYVRNMYKALSKIRVVEEYIGVSPEKKVYCSLLNTNIPVSQSRFIKKYKDYMFKSKNSLQEYQAANAFKSKFIGKSHYILKDIYRKDSESLLNTFVKKVISKKYYEILSNNVKEFSANTSIRFTFNSNGLNIYSTYNYDRKSIYIPFKHVNFFSLNVFSNTLLTPHKYEESKDNFKEKAFRKNWDMYTDLMRGETAEQVLQQANF